LPLEDGQFRGRAIVTLELSRSERTFASAAACGIVIDEHQRAFREWVLASEDDDHLQSHHEMWFGETGRTIRVTRYRPRIVVPERRTTETTMTTETAKERLNGLLNLIYAQQQPSVAIPQHNVASKTAGHVVVIGCCDGQDHDDENGQHRLGTDRGQPSDHLIAAARDARLFGSVGRASLCDINDDDTVYFRLDCCDRMKFSSSSSCSFYPLSNVGQDDTDWHVFVCVRPCSPLFPDNVVEMNLWNHNLP
jgi:hypothetical protein